MYKLHHVNKQHKVIFLSCFQWIFKKERNRFDRVFSRKEIPSEIPVYKSPSDNVDIIEVLCNAKLVSTRNEARRLIQQRGITIGENVIQERFLHVPPGGVVIKVGKRRFLKIVNL